MTRKEKPSTSRVIALQLFTTPRCYAPAKTQCRASPLIVASKVGGGADLLRKTLVLALFIFSTFFRGTYCPTNKHGERMALRLVLIEETIFIHQDLVVCSKVHSIVLLNGIPSSSLTNTPNLLVYRQWEKRWDALSLEFACKPGEGRSCSALRSQDDGTYKAYCR
jgi:hypothetical protein